MSTPFDLHVLSTPPAFILSQDQTLNKMVSKELSLLKSLYRSHPLASKKSVKSLSSHSTRKDICPFLVLRVSFFTLFNLQGARRFAAGFYFTTFRGACQALFSTSFEVFRALGSFASYANSFILPDFRAFVKNFFGVFRISRDSRTRSL